MDEIKRQLNA